MLKRLVFRNTRPRSSPPPTPQGGGWWVQPGLTPLSCVAVRTRLLILLRRRRRPCPDEEVREQHVVDDVDDSLADVAADVRLSDGRAVVGAHEDDPVLLARGALYLRVERAPLVRRELLCVFVSVQYVSEGRGQKRLVRMALEVSSGTTPV